MDVVLYTNILKGIGLTASIGGVLIGIDLIFGGPIISISKRALEKSFDFDKWVKGVLDKSFDFDKVITNAKTRKTLGILFLAFALVIILLIIKI
ncbi:hypothetical protein ACFL1D_00390 [Candidatus Omnitrophota bacterium]